MWRSLVAYAHGVRVVAGSNPVIPTKKSQAKVAWLFYFPGASKTCFCKRPGNKKPTKRSFVGFCCTPLLRITEPSEVIQSSRRTTYKWNQNTVNHMIFSVFCFLCIHLNTYEYILLVYNQVSKFRRSLHYL